MGFSRLPIAFLILATLPLQGCYFRLLQPEPQVLAAASPRSSEKLKVSYWIERPVGSYSQFQPDPENARKALLDSLSAFQIQDVITSEKLERDRVNLFIYLLGGKPAGVMRYLGLPWALISLGTLTVVPLYQKDIHQVEIHVVIPDREHAPRVKIVQTCYVTAKWVWLPLIIVPNDEKNSKAGFGGTALMRSVDYWGLRRLFDAIIVELLADQ